MVGWGKVFIFPPHKCWPFIKTKSLVFLWATYSFSFIEKAWTDLSKYINWRWVTLPSEAAKLLITKPFIFPTNVFVPSVVVEDESPTKIILSLFRV